MGRLEDMPFEDIVQMLSMSQRTGKLTVTCGTAKAVVVFKRGEIISASSDQITSSLGQALVARNMVSESMLALALDVQQRVAPVKLLGSILLEMNALQTDALEDVIREQIQKVIYSVITWREGCFKFDRLESNDYLQAELSGRELLLSSGMRADHVMLDAAKQLDETGPPQPPPTPLPFAPRKREPTATVSSRTGAATEIIEPLSPGDILEALTQEGNLVDRAAARGVVATASDVAFLKSIIDETRSSQFVGEISLMIMRGGVRLVKRGVLFAVSSEWVRGIGQFGLPLSIPQANEQVRRIRIPLDQPSVFRKVMENGQSCRGKLAKTFWDDYLVRQLGEEPPNDVVVVPMVVNGVVVSIFYGDNVPGNEPIGSIEAMELLMLYAALGMERTILEAKAARQPKVKSPVRENSQK